MTTTLDRHEEAVARLVVEAIRQARELYPNASPEALEAMARLLLRRGALVLMGKE